ASGMDIFFVLVEPSTADCDATSVGTEGHRRHLCVSFNFRPNPAFQGHIPKYELTLVVRSKLAGDHCDPSAIGTESDALDASAEPLGGEQPHSGLRVANRKSPTSRLKCERPLARARSNFGSIRADVHRPDWFVVTCISPFIQMAKALDKVPFNAAHLLRT